MRLLVVTGVSGAGKSTALRALEDVGYYTADNIPLPQLAELVELVEKQGVTQVAALIDSRQRAFLGEAPRVLGKMKADGRQIEVLFLDATDADLLRRFSETRRRHPLAGDDLRSGIEAEREVLAPLREMADAVVDTGSLNVHQLKGIIQERYGAREGRLKVTLLSFGYKHGLPAEADIVLDVRHLPNPYFVAALSGLIGTNDAVASFVLEGDEGKTCLAKTLEFLEYALPRHAAEGKSYLTIAVGCTGGRHRSVAMVEALARRLGGAWPVTIRHRDIGRGPGKDT